MEIAVLGAGIVGSAVVKDLAEEADFRVTAVDKNGQTLEKLANVPHVKAITGDLNKRGFVASVVADCDLVICAVPGFMGFETLKGIMAAGKPAVDISFFEEDPFMLDDLAKSKGVTAVVDCGVAPGLCNILAGHVEAVLDKVDSYVCYVGGLPRIRQWPFEYKAVFSPSDVLEEYTRPARFIEYGQEVVRPALSDIEPIHFPGIGTLEAFNTDGLRSLRKTMGAPFMKEKTLRYPGHAQLMRVFVETGFLSEAPVEVEGQSVRPIALTSKLLFDQWRLEEGEEDFTIMQVIAEGQKGGKRYRYTYDLLDTYDRETHTTSMARTTGYTCTIVARQVLRGLFTQRGICPPEFIGRTGRCYENLLSEYEKRGIGLKESVVEI
jgi:saccharopine dehydrogenase-like NADP-dependent oxidoreductase